MVASARGGAKLAYKPESFTDGPWEANGTVIETVRTPAICVGRVYDDRDGCGIDSDGEALANAYLFAAAPDLYAALAAMLGRYGMHSNSDIKRAADALAKARGENPGG